MPMVTFDPDVLLIPVSEASPSGPDLEYESPFIDLEQAAREEPEQQFGDTIVPGRQPDWNVVAHQAIEVLGQSKDLRAVVHLLKALIHLKGFAGLAEGLAFLRALLERFWDSLHPQLDPDDDLDPTTRVNIIAAIASPDLVMSVVRLTPVFVSRLVGPISLREIQIARGQASPSPDTDHQPPGLDVILAAAADLPSAEIDAVVDQIKGSTADLRAIESFVTDRVGAASAMSLDLLAHALGEINSLLDEVNAAREGGSGARTETSHELDTEEGRNHDQANLQRGEIKTRNDVIRALDRIIDYYSSQEPGSPVPLLLRRARRLVNLGFMEILADLVPDALAQASQLTGAQPPDPSSSMGRSEMQ